ncbi:MAG: polA [Parcubacteria group bacterium]|nr:polA [Parcubacteria group bacterium]
MEKTAKEDKKKLVLLDAHAIIHRAYHALPADFVSSKGEPTGALYGLSAMLLKIIKDLKPDYLIACYDLPKPTHRHEAYKEYKAGRTKAEPELISQLKRSRDIFEAFSIPIYDKEGFEADDIIGTAVEKLKDDKNTDIIIASGDMDTLQLVKDKKVQVYTLKKGINDTIIYDEKAVRERFGFDPELLVDYKGLRGDPSDNIIGIKGIGEKTATLLIQKFGTIENIYKALKKDKESFKKAGFKDRVIGLLEEGEEEADFSKILGTIRRDAPIEFVLPAKNWSESVDSEKIERLWNELDFRTLGARLKDTLSGFSGKDAPARGNKDESDNADAVMSPEIPVNETKEVSVALWLLNSNITNPGLEDILNYTNKKSFAEAKKIILSEVEKQGLGKVLEEIEKPIIPIISQMGIRGVRIDVRRLKRLSVEYHKELDILLEKIAGYSGEKFNMNSPKQLGEMLFVKMGLKTKNHKKTGGGALSTKESELEKMRDLHPIIPLILEYRELQKLLSTYIDNIPTMLGDDGRLHTSFLQAGTTTGRMSSQNPNLQNIPNKSELGRNIRKSFIADKGFKLVAFDYSQMELRIAAFLSGDEKLVEIFRKGEDVHTAVASEVFGVSFDKVDKEMRRQAKVINFGIIYGMGINALRQNLGTDRESAQKFYNEYFNKFSGLAEYLEKVKNETYKKGYTETFFGRRRYFEGLNSPLPYIRASAERMAINAPIQGTGADIVKLAMSKVDEYLSENNLKEDARLLLQVHDELLFEIKDSLVKKVSPEIKKIMESVISPKETKGIVCAVDVSMGDNWGEMVRFAQD